MRHLEPSGRYFAIAARCTCTDSAEFNDDASTMQLTKAVLRLFRDEGSRGDRQKARLMWLIEEKGVDAFRSQLLAEIDSYDRGVRHDKAQPPPTGKYERRELLGVHAQPQPGKMRVGIHVPVGRRHPDVLPAVGRLLQRVEGGGHRSGRI